MLGVYDSGVGGLTVWKEIKALHPTVPLLYYADTKNAPYGPLGKKALLKYARNAFSFLIDHGATQICVACHSISTNCQKELLDSFSLPIHFVPSVTLQILSSYNQIGVIGTRATVRSNFYQLLLKDRLKEISPCPPFAPMIEGGTIDIRILQKYLKKFNTSEALFLACTHYPIIKNQISELLPGIPLVDPAKAFAETIEVPQSEGDDLFFSSGNNLNFENFLSLF